MSALSRIFVGVCAAGLAACTTVTPLQTASTVDPGTWRLGVQGSLSPWCGLSLGFGVSCASVPEGVPVPEGRLSARYGWGDGFDTGISLHASGVLPVGIQAGALVDAKWQVASLPVDEERRHVLAASVGGGASTEQAGLFDGSTPRSGLTRIDVPVAAWYGYQTQAGELVVSPRFVERVYFGSSTSDVAWVGITAGWIWRGHPTHFGITLDYFAPTVLLDEGLFTVSAGVLFDVGGRL